MIQVTVRIAGTGIDTSLWPKDRVYIVPPKKSLKESERVGLGDEVGITFSAPSSVDRSVPYCWDGVRGRRANVHEGGLPRMNSVDTSR